MRNDVIDAVMAELAVFGIKGQFQHRGKHGEIEWFIGQSADIRRSYYVPLTPSDWRARLNARSEIRRMMRADNVQPAAPEKAISFAKAMSLPEQPIERPDQRLTRMERDIEGLLDILGENRDEIQALRAELGTLNHKLMNVRAVVTLQFEAPTTTTPAATPLLPNPLDLGTVIPFKSPTKMPRVTKQDQLLQLLQSRQWTSLETLCRGLEGGYNHEIQARTGALLSVLKGKNLVENGQRGWWRLKPEAQIASQ